MLVLLLEDCHFDDQSLRETTLLITDTVTVTGSAVVHPVNGDLHIILTAF